MRKLLSWLMILALALSLCAANAESTVFLKEGNSGDVVTVLQKDLIALGYLSGKADGHYGEDTARAVENYRETKQLSAEGGVDADMILAMYEDQGSPTLTKGSASICVYAVQRALVIAGFLNDTPDGKFGKSTLVASKEYMQYAAKEMVAFAQAKEDERISGLEALSAAEMPVPVDEAIITEENVVTDGSIDDVWFEFIISGQVSYGPTLRRGDKSTAVKRMQLRLKTLKYLAAGTDGSFGENTERALKYFQYKNDLEQTGEFDPATQEAIYSETAVVSDEYVSPYKAFVNTRTNTLYIAEWMGTGYDLEHVKSTRCTTGAKATPTVKGTFQAVGQGGVQWWHMDGCWVQYPFIIYRGYFFHSLLYNNAGDKHPTSASVHNLGKNASHGCVRLQLQDAKWIYENCLPGMTVVIK